MYYFERPRGATKEGYQNKVFNNWATRGWVIDSQSFLHYITAVANPMKKARMNKRVKTHGYYKGRHQP